MEEKEEGVSRNKEKMEGGWWSGMYPVRGCVCACVAADNPALRRLGQRLCDRDKSGSCLLSETSFCSLTEQMHTRGA